MSDRAHRRVRAHLHSSAAAAGAGGAGGGGHGGGGRRRVRQQQGTLHHPPRTRDLPHLLGAELPLRDDDDGQGA